MVSFNSLIFCRDFFEGEPVSIPRCLQDSLKVKPYRIITKSISEYYVVMQTKRAQLWGISKNILTIDTQES